MTKITHIILIALFFVFTNSSIAKTKFKINENTLSYTNNNMQRVRIDFKTSNGFTRHLLLTFTKDNSADDNYNYGYDAINNDNYPNDLNWIVDNKRCTIQGVGSFNENKKYPFWMLLTQNEDVEISLESLENFDSPIDVFIYDKLLKTYTHINNINYAASIANGEYSDRFFITFKNENNSNSNNSVNKNTLDTDKNNIEKTRINYLSSSKELYINTNGFSIIKSVNLYNILGQSLISLDQINLKVIKIPLKKTKTPYGIVIIQTDKGFINKKILIQ